jgi:two-component system OmpR family sensor kinase
VLCSSDGERGAARCVGEHGGSIIGHVRGPGAGPGWRTGTGVAACRREQPVVSGHSSAITARRTPVETDIPALHVRRTLPAVRLGIRLQVVGWFVVLLLLSCAITAFVLRETLLARLSADIDFELVQETSEVARLASGLNPATGQPFGDDAAGVYELLFRRSLPDEGETFYAIVDRQPFMQTDAPVSLFDDAEVLAAWRAAMAPISGVTDTEAGPVRWRAAPLKAGNPQPGVFAVAFYEAARRGQIDQTILLLLGVSAAVVLAASILAWVAAGRAIAPLRDLTATARGIDDSDLGTRIPVTGPDEVAHLTAVLNAMLQRLEVAFSSQREFLDDVGHELRTPITIVRGHLELLDDDPVDRRRTIEVVLAQLDRMNRCVDDLLLLARAERPDFLHPGSVALGEFAAQVLAMVRPLGDRDWRLVLGESGTVQADADRLTQAMVNLTTNAVRHTEPGEQIELGAAMEGTHARLWVRDEGMGIAPEDQERIFRRFVRGRGRATNRSEGTGLGLAIVNAIAVAHGGRTELESVVGVGSTFSLVIPTGSPPPGGVS